MNMVKKLYSKKNRRKMEEEKVGGDSIVCDYVTV